MQKALVCPESKAVLCWPTLIITQSDRGSMEDLFQGPLVFVSIFLAPPVASVSLDFFLHVVGVATG